MLIGVTPPSQQGASWRLFLSLKYETSEGQPGWKQETSGFNDACTTSRVIEEAVEVLPSRVED